MPTSHHALIIAALSVVSFVAGFIDSIAGGGGLILIPALLFAGIPPQTTLGTNKFASVFGTGIATLNYIRNKMVVLRIAAFGVAFSLLGSFLGSRAILVFSDATVGKIIVFLLPVAVAITLVPKKPRKAEVELPTPKLLLAVPLICLCIGFYDGFFGPGTGSFLILAFYLLAGLDLVRASGTAKVFNLASGVAALLVFLRGGTVLFELGIPLALANVAGNYAGSALAIKRGSKIVRAFLVVSLSIAFVSLLLKYFKK